MSSTRGNPTLPKAPAQRGEINESTWPWPRTWGDEGWQCGSGWGGRAGAWGQLPELVGIRNARGQAGRPRKGLGTAPKAGHETPFPKQGTDGLLSSQAVAHTVPRPQSSNPRIPGRARVASRPLTLPPQPSRAASSAHRPTLPSTQAHGGPFRQRHRSQSLHQPFSGETT